MCQCGEHLQAKDDCEFFHVFAKCLIDVIIAYAIGVALLKSAASAAAELLECCDV